MLGVLTATQAAPTGSAPTVYAIPVILIAVPEKRTLPCLLHQRLLTLRDTCRGVDGLEALPRAWRPQDDLNNALLFLS